MAAHRAFEAVAPPAALPRAPGLRDRVRAWRLVRRGGVALGAGVVLGRDLQVVVEPGGSLVLGDGAVMGDGCRVHVRPGATARIGEGAVLGTRCILAAHAGVTIGAGSVLADEVVLLDFDHRFDDVERPVREQGLTVGPVVVGEGVRIGPGAAVLRGVTVGDGAVVSAHAVVTRPVAAGAVVSGVPAGPPRAPQPPARPARAGRGRR